MKKIPWICQIGFFQNISSAGKNVPLDDFLEGIINGKWAAAVEEVRNAGDKETREKRKKALPAAMLSGTTNGGHKTADLDVHSGILQIDIDHVDDVVSIRDRIGRDRHVGAAWISPSGDGVKAIMRIPADKELHKIAFTAAMEYFREIHEINIDEKCSNLARLCFAGHDPEMVINPDAVPLEVANSQCLNSSSPSVYKVRTSAPAETLLEAAKSHLMKMPPSVSGERGHDKAIKAAVALVKGFDLTEEEAFPLLVEWNKNCVPPWSEKELRHKLKEAATKSFKTPGYLLKNLRSKAATPSIAPALWQYSKNDLGNSEALATFIQGQAFFCPQLQAWFIYRLRWERDGSQQISVMASNLSRQALQEAGDLDDHHLREEAVKRALKIGNLGPMQNAITLAATDPRVVVHLNQLDTDPSLIGVENGVLNLMTGELVPASHEIFVTRCIRTTFNPHASCPVWESFIERVTRDYEGLAEFIQRSVGYSLTGQTTEHVFWFLHGDGRNGKSTFIETLQKLSGEYGIRASEKLLAISKHGSEAPLDEIAGLYGMRLLFGSETQEGVRLNEKFIKDLTGGDTILGRRLYQPAFQFRPTCKLWMFGNHKPEICGTDLGIWRRVLMIPFTARLTDEEIDKGLLSKLRAELPGILNWAIAGLQRWKRLGLAPPPCVTQATTEYRSDQDILGDFINEKIIQTPGTNTTKAVMFNSYERWATEKGYRSFLSSKRLSRQLKARGFRELQTRMWADCLMCPH